MIHRKNLAAANRIVIKIGSSSLTHVGGKLNLLRIERLVRVISDLHNSGKEVVLVSSGAIATGAGKMGLEKKPENKITKQALAAIGQAELIKIYDKFFEEYNKTVAQVLLTRDGIENPLRRNNAKNTLKELINMGIIPVINENDTVSTEEIEFGDNDNLSAIVAALLESHLLVILSDIDGVFTGDPNKDSGAKLISKVLDVEEEAEKYIFSHSSAFGTGGMASKLTAARHCLKNNVDMVITNGSDPYIIYEVLEGKDVGTYFVSGTSLSKTKKTKIL